MSSVGDEFHGLDNEFLALDHHRRVMPSTAPCGPVGPIYGEKPFTGHLVGPLASGAQREGKTGCKPGTPTRENRVKSAPGKVVWINIVDEVCNLFMRNMSELKMINNFHGTTCNLDLANCLNFLLKLQLADLLNLCQRILAKVMTTLRSCFMI